MTAVARTPERRATRAAVVAFLVFALLGGGALVAAGASDRRTTAFSLGIPDGGVVVSLPPGSRACQGPIGVVAPFAGLRLWLRPARAPRTRLRISVLTAAGGQHATGVLTPAVTPPGVRGSHPPLAVAASTRLSRSVAAGSVVSLCFANAGRATVSLLGAQAQRASGVLAQNGRQSASAAAVVLLRPRPSSLLSSLPTIFQRAALFRPTWMGAWTFWLLLAGAVVVVFPLGAVAVAVAAREDDADQDA